MWGTEDLVKEWVLVVTCAVFTEQAGSGLCFAAEAAGGVRSGKQQVWSRAGCGGALLRGCLQAVQESSEEIWDTRDAAQSWMETIQRRGHTHQGS